MYILRKFYNNSLIALFPWIVDADGFCASWSIDAGLWRVDRDGIMCQTWEAFEDNGRTIEFVALMKKELGL